MALPSLRPYVNDSLTASGEVSSSGHQSNPEKTTPDAMSDSSNPDKAPESSEARSSTDSHDAIPLEDRNSSRQASQTQYANMLMSLERLKTLSGNIDDSNWSHDAKTVFKAAVDVRLKQLRKRLQDKGLRVGGLNTLGTNHKATTKGFNYEEAELLMEREDEFYEYLKDVRKRAQVNFEIEAREKDKSRKAVEEDVRSGRKWD
ncbi:hypothetical protein QBC45DRAFT_456126 [Copromyces sp. CBS 386.78]|nr:hypothetical protein QBC45DRAFT_456126 [Copromyces sp. CBS 386.78]